MLNVNFDNNYPPSVFSLGLGIPPGELKKLADASEDQLRRNDLINRPPTSINSASDSSSVRSDSLYSSTNSARRGSLFSLPRFLHIKAQNSREPIDKLSQYVAHQEGSTFDISAFSSDGRYAALVNSQELAIFRFQYQLDDPDIVAIRPLVRRYKPISATSATSIALVSADRFEIYSFMIDALPRRQPAIIQECRDIVSIALASDNSHVCVCTKNGELQRWKINAAVLEGQPPIKLQRSACTMSFSPSNAKIAVASWDGCIYVFDVETGQECMAHWSTNNHLMGRDNHGFTGIAFTPDEQYIITSSWAQNGCVMRRKISKESSWQLLSPEKTKTQSLAVSPSGVVAFVDKRNVYLGYQQSVAPSRYRLFNRASTLPGPRASIAFISSSNTPGANEEWPTVREGGNTLDRETLLALDRYGQLVSFGDVGRIISTLPSMFS